MKLSPWLRAATREPHTQSAFCNPASSFGKVRRVILQIRVEGDDHLPAGRLHSGPQRRRLTTLAGEPLGAQARFGSGNPLQQSPTAVTAGVVRDNDLKRLPQRVERRANGRDQRLQVVLLLWQGSTTLISISVVLIQNSDDRRSPPESWDKCGFNNRELSAASLDGHRSNFRACVAQTTRYRRRMRRALPVLVLILLFWVMLPVAADTGRVTKVLLHFLDLQGHSALSPSLYDRDAYQAQLRKHPEQCSGMRFDILWRARAASPTRRPGCASSCAYREG